MIAWEEAAPMRVLGDFENQPSYTPTAPTIPKATNPPIK